MNINLFNLDEKVALITGSSGGLGLTLAGGLAEAGATVVLNGRNKDKLASAASALKAQGANVSGYAFDITKVAEVTKSVAQIEAEVGPIDILVNNAGINLRGPLEEVSEELFREVIDINLTGAFITAQQVVKSMLKRDEGKIVNICSLMSEIGRPTTGPYTASKGALKMLTKAMATEWAKHNIQVNGIGPGYFLSEMTQALADDPKFDTWIKGRTPAGRWGDPRELIGTTVFLASDASSFVNGQVIYVDGGILASL